MKINSKTKGSKAERGVSKLFQKWTGFEFTRTPASGGLRWQRKKDTVGDIICSDDKHSRYFCFSIEVKSYKDIDFSHPLYRTSKVSEFWLQALDEAKRANKIPILMMRYNNLPKDMFFLGMPIEFYHSVFSVIYPGDYNKLLMKCNPIDIAIIDSRDFFKSDYKLIHKSSKLWIKKNQPALG